MQANSLSCPEAREPTRLPAVHDWGSQQRLSGRWGDFSSSLSIAAFTGSSLCLDKLECLPASLHKIIVQVVLCQSKIASAEDGQ